MGGGGSRPRKSPSPSPISSLGSSYDLDKVPLVDERDREYARAQSDPELRDAIVCAVTTYRRPDKLAVGDPVPNLELERLDESPPLQLADAVGRPLVLFFGSYT